MNTILNQLQELADSDLYALCEAVDIEIAAPRRDDRRHAGFRPPRAIQRSGSYRRRTGAAAPPVRAVGLHAKKQSDRRAA